MPEDCAFPGCLRDENSTVHVLPPQGCYCRGTPRHHATFAIGSEEPTGVGLVHHKYQAPIPMPGITYDE